MSKSNNHRIYNNSTRQPHHLDKVRKEEAAVRKQEYEGLSISDKIAKLDLKLGKDVGAKKQRAKLAALTNAPAAKSAAVEEIDSLNDEKKHLKAKDRRKQERK